MSFFDTFKQILELVPTDKVGEVIDSLKTDNEMVAQVNSMLLQVQQDPESARSVATAIIGMRGVPGVVRDMVQGLPKAAQEPTGLHLSMLITSIQSQMAQRKGWFA